MTSNQLVNQIRKAIKGPVEEFLKQPSEAAKEQETAKAQIEKAKQELAKTLGGKDNSAYKAAAASLDAEAKNTGVDGRSEQAARRREAAAALVEAAGDLKLPVRIKPNKKTGKPGRPRGSRKRMTAAEMAGAVDKIHKALPDKKSEFISKSELAKKVGFDPSSVLLKMKRDGTAVSNGRRGVGGGWRRGKKPS